MIPIPEISWPAIYGAVKWLGSFGGFLYLIDLYRKRVRIRVWILDEDFYSKRPPAVAFEVENIGLTQSSIAPVVLMRAFLPRPRENRGRHEVVMEPREAVFNIEGVQRKLEPYTPIRLEAVSKHASPDLSASLGSMWFKTYTFSFTRGGKRKVRIRSADRVPLAWWRYLYERLDFRFRGRVTPSPELEREVSDALSS